MAGLVIIKDNGFHGDWIAVRLPLVPVLVLVLLVLWRCVVLVLVLVSVLVPWC